MTLRFKRTYGNKMEIADRGGDRDFAARLRTSDTMNKENLTTEEPLTIVQSTPLRLDLGCGPNPKEGFVGVDKTSFGNEKIQIVDLIARHDKFVTGDSNLKRWPWQDESVEEIHSSHFIEHLTNLNGAWERVHFFNECYRVMKVGSKMTLIFPHWCSNRYYGDPTHKEPFSEMGFYYLSRDWRAGHPSRPCPCKNSNSSSCNICGGKREIVIPAQAPHTDITNNPNGYSCNFQCTWGFSLHPHLLTRNQEYQQHALQFWKESAQDIIATLTKIAYDQPT